MSEPFAQLPTFPVDAPPFLVLEENLDDEVRDYIAVMAEQHPFSINMDIDERFVIPRLAKHWPDEPIWPLQAYALWESIDNVVHSIPAITTTPNILLRLSAAAGSLVPSSIPEPQEPSALATFDGVNGVMHRCVLPPLEKLPSLEDMAIPLGVMAICQPVAPMLISQFKDSRSAALIAGANIYSERNRDNIAPENNLG
ncbi:MAG: hypothetical protein P4M13_09870 [Alphaproteobacteria bacterium]|nr:hypothetical protein [Alphaproteobacteria bacterium]